MNVRAFFTNGVGAILKARGTFFEFKVYPAASIKINLVIILGLNDCKTPCNLSA